MSAIALKEAESKTSRSLFFATEEEFDTWCDEDTKADYVDGEVIVMSPESTIHGFEETRFGSLLELFVKKNKLGFVISTGNTQIRLRAGLRRNPDIIFVEKSQAHLIHETYIDGAPDLIAEFVSPESAIRDWHEKYIEYEAAGVGLSTASSSASRFIHLVRIGAIMRSPRRREKFIPRWRRDFGSSSSGCGRDLSLTRMRWQRRLELFLSTSHRRLKLPLRRQANLISLSLHPQLRNI